jgi:hypothetical protein
VHEQVNSRLIGWPHGHARIQEQARDTPSGRGLFALPTQYIGDLRHTFQMMSQWYFGESTVLPEGFHLLLKAFLLFGAIIYTANYSTTPHYLPNYPSILRCAIHIQSTQQYYLNVLKIKYLLFYMNSLYFRYYYSYFSRSQRGELCM